ncbi:MAG TPA: hypothetical protein VEK11_09740 [Thermoanaerobaculia bacterium]|nr:hypothetical protein [Thermoanaerobaculia bacterium]
MKRLIVMILFAAGAFAQATDPVPQVADDAIVLDRVAEASKRDLPTDLLKRIVNEDIELLRGRRADGSYEYATYERFEAGRITTSHSVQPRSDKMATIEVRGANVYRVIVDVPSRRLLLRKNNPVWVERLDVDMVAGPNQVQRQTFDVKAWIQPGEIRPIDLPVIARQATVKVIATADEKQGYGNLDVALVQARIVDLAASPYAEAVTAAKAALRALENGEVAALRSASQRMRDALHVRRTEPAALATTPGSVVDVVRPLPQETASRIEMQAELQVIEDLLTGSEAERRQGLDRLHQLIRRMR